MSKKYYIVTFNSTHYALKFEKEAKENEIKIIIMPVPRNIAASCGLAVKFEHEHLKEVMDIVRDKQLDYAFIYRIEESSGKKDYIKLDIQAL